MRLTLLLFFVLCISSCKQQHKSPISSPQKTQVETTVLDTIKLKNSEQAQLTSDCLDSFTKQYQLIDIQQLDSSIQVDLRYASTNNFLNQQLYTQLKKLYLQSEVAHKIVRCQAYLKSIHPQYSLLIYDGARPVSAQLRMWNALDSIPPAERGKFVSNPKNHSVHNYGAAVDLTIIDENRIPLDMGADFDDFRPIAFPSLEQQHLASSELTEQQVSNRKLLRQVMSSQGFNNIPSEWWHFNAYSRNVVKQKFKVILNEPNCP